MNQQETCYCLVLCTCSTLNEARHISKTIVEERLAACVNLIPAVESFYRWQGVLQEESERLLLIKTYTTLFEALKLRICQLHSYETPEVVALPLVMGSRSYFDWIDECLAFPSG